MAAKLTWTTRSVRVSELKLLDYNPRKISEADKRRLMASLEKFGVADIPVCNTDGTVISGNQRVTALRDLGRGEDMLDVRWPGRRLTQTEVKEYAVTANTHAGEWDWDMLKEHFAEVQLVDFGLALPSLPTEVNLDGKDIPNLKQEEPQLGYERLVQIKLNQSQYDSIIGQIKTLCANVGGEINIS